MIFQLLVDWTKGKNVIVASAAPFVSEIRGPYDVANLLDLLGFPCERAKTAVSKNCRYANLKSLCFILFCCAISNCCWSFLFTFITGLS